ncbi:MAG: glycosyltransferase family 2 protein [Bryobacterales bacterium]|nr:glycosyltransferase family 2 protein [Bryobacterales bacterium]
MVPTQFPLALLTTATTLSRLQRELLDDTFAGIHTLGWFDYALLIPYFTVLIVLSIYGLHRYSVIREYFKHRHVLNQPPAKEWGQLPRVTIQLPLFNERYVVERLIETVVKMDYPRELLEIQVLDDSTDETHPFTERLVNEYAAMGHPIVYIHRTNRHGFKAGALQEGMYKAKGEFFAIFDADFIPPTDFLRRTIHYFTDSNIGMVQTRWTYLNRDYNLLTEVQAMLLDGHFVLEHGARFGGGTFFNFNGTAGILRRRMIEDAGGWEHDTLTEDSDLSYRAQIKGWRFHYVPSVECPSELPVDTHAFQVQQSRWAKGLMQVCMKLIHRILKADVPFKVKAEAFCHLTPNISYPLMIVVSALMLPVMMVRFYIGWWEMLFIDLPLVIASFWSVSAFYVIAQRELYPRTWWKAFFFLPALMSAGIALTLINTKAVAEALMRIQSSFVRTAKFGIGEKKVAVEKKKYRSRSGMLPYLELAFGTYFLGMVAYAIDTFNFLAVPILMLFVGGYYWAGFSTLWQEYQDRMRWQAAQRMEAEPAR